MSRRERIRTIAAAVAPPVLSMGTVAAVVLVARRLIQVDVDHLGLAPLLRVPAGDLALGVQEIAARLVWGMSAVVLVVACVATAVAAVVVLDRALLDSGVGPSRFALTVATVGAVAVPAFVVARFDFGGVTSTLVNETFARTGLRGVSVLPNALHGLSFASVALVLAASCAALGRPPGTGDRVDHLVRQLRRLQVLLYVSALALVAGVVEVTALMRWSTVLLPSSAAADAIRSLATIWPAIVGTTYTLLLIAVFVPAMAILAHRGRALAPDRDPKAADRWMEEQGLRSPLTAQVSRVLAVLGPLLAGGPAPLLLDLLRA